VKYIAGANEAPELKEARPANHTERKWVVIVISCGDLRNQSDLKLQSASWIPQFCKPLWEKKSSRFDAPDTGREKMAIKK
jgi:hypothetical protein